MNGKQLCIKYGLTEKEFRELKNNGTFTAIGTNQYDEKQVQRYFDEYWKKHISAVELKKYNISNSKLTKLIKDKVILKSGKYYDRPSVEEYVKSNDYKEYIAFKNKTTDSLVNVRNS